MASPDFSEYPPGLAILAGAVIDTVCQPLFCQDWRSYVKPVCSEWCSPSVEKISDILSPFMSYSDFLEGRQSNWQELYQFAFQTPSTALANLTSREAVVALFLLVLIFRSIKAVLLPFFSDLGRKAGRAAHGPDWEAANEIRIVKFGEYVFRLMYHSFIATVGIWYFHDKEWWSGTGTTVLFDNWPNHEVEVGMIWYYLVQSAYNIDALVSLAQLSFDVVFQNPLEGQFPVRVQWSKTVRGDFREMAIHHAVTNLLVVGSSFFRLTRIGSMVFLVHDISDVPVDLSKLANFVKWKIATAVCFSVLILFWLIFRLGIFPFVIYRSVLTESHLMLNSGLFSPEIYLAYRLIFYYLMGQLLVLHVIWLIMIARIGYLLAFKGQYQDLTEHKNGEDHGMPTSSSKQNGGYSKANGSKND